MKIEGIPNVPHSNAVTKTQAGAPDRPNKDFSNYLSVKQGEGKSVSLPRNVTREMIQDFAEWYFKQGRSYESAKSYKQAISAYEKANSVQPGPEKAASIDSARVKEYNLHRK